MKITIENTTKTVTADGVLCRVWEGVSDSGIRVVCLIPRIAVAEGQDVSQFEKELQQTKAPSPETQAFPLRMVL